MGDNERNGMVHIRLGRRVGYEISIDNNKASMGRLGQAIIEHNLLLTSFLSLSEKGTIFMKIFVDPEKIEAVAADLKAISFQYSGPTFFHRSRMIPRYNSGEDELAGRESKAYRAFKASNIRIFLTEQE